MNAAGVAGGGPVHLIAPAEWDRVIDVNLKGSFHVSRHVVPVMLEAGGGSIVHVASVEGLEGFEGGSAYNASKGGVVLLTRNMAIDYGRKGIRVNAVCPGFIETPLFGGIFEQPGMEAIKARIEDAHQLGRFGRPGRGRERGALPRVRRGELRDGRDPHRRRRLHRRAPRRRRRADGTGLAAHSASSVTVA